MVVSIIVSHSALPSLHLLSSIVVVVMTPPPPIIIIPGDGEDGPAFKHLVSPIVIVPYPKTLLLLLLLFHCWHSQWPWGILIIGDIVWWHYRWWWWWHFAWLSGEALVNKWWHFGDIWRVIGGDDGHFTVSVLMLKRLRCLLLWPSILRNSVVMEPHCLEVVSKPPSAPAPDRPSLPNPQPTIVIVLLLFPSEWHIGNVHCPHLSIVGPVCCCVLFISLSGVELVLEVITTFAPGPCPDPHCVTHSVSVWPSGGDQGQPPISVLWPHSPFSCYPGNSPHWVTICYGDGGDGDILLWCVAPSLWPPHPHPSLEGDAVAVIIDPVLFLQW